MANKNPQSRKGIFSDSIIPKKEGGIYAIINRENGKIYIGSAVNLRERFNSHRSFLGRRRYHNVYLKRAFLKNPSAFEFSVVEIVKNISDLIAREQFWMDFYQCCEPANGYNICPTAGSSLGIKHDDAYKKRMSEALKGRKLPPRTKEHTENQAATRRGKPNLKDSKPIILIKSDGTELRFQSLSKASKILGRGFTAGNICAYLKGFRKNKTGYTWKYVSN